MFIDLKVNFLFIHPISSPSENNGVEENNIAATGAATVTSNSTQTPSDLSPHITNNDDMLPQAHHQNPGHCIASFSAINRMRQNSQVGAILFLTMILRDLL